MWLQPRQPRILSACVRRAIFARWRSVRTLAELEASWIALRARSADLLDTDSLGIDGVVGHWLMTERPPPEPDESLDQLTRDWWVYQLKRGHRFSTDDVVTAWTAGMARPDARALIDIGAGIGSVGLMTHTSWDRRPGASSLRPRGQPPTVPKSIDQQTR